MSVKKTLLAMSMAALAAVPLYAQSPRSESLLRDWDFSRDSISWNPVTVPHDWAIYGPFDRMHDIQNVAIEQNGETEKTWKTGRTGGLPYMGTGYYTTTFNIPSDVDLEETDYTLVFDGAMSHARVFLNGEEIGYRPYGYVTFSLPASKAVRHGENRLEVSLSNEPYSSRWYPGAGLYRNVHLVKTSKVHIPEWGLHVTTPHVSPEKAGVHIAVSLEGLEKGEKVTLTTSILSPEGKEVARESRLYQYYPGVELNQNFIVSAPRLWSPSSPDLYTAVTEVSKEGKLLDEYRTRFGIRTVEARPGEGFFLNGEKIMFKGVCNHHDLGPLGAAVNRSALRHQLEIMKDMGANAIRTSHNMPAPELVELCDEMGLMLMIEPFDDWGFRPKSPNGYGSLFAEWAEKDVADMVRQYRNNPSVVMWSIGNEVPSQWGPDGVGELKMLQDIVHREDPTRPVTCGMDQFDAVVNNGFAAALDIPGFNYKPSRYAEALGKLPQNFILGSETASTVSTRGKYFFPVELASNKRHEGNFCSSYDTEYCYWSNIPEDDFIQDDDNPAVMGQFVWTGFDYLGEPTPYDDEGWPSRSSQFGIVDLASIPKDRFYLYRSKWNTDDHTLHILPHWNWPGREGEVTPVFVYTDSPKAELFINGRSQGMREKNDSTPMSRYRLMWNETVYEPGEVKVVAYDADGSVAGEKSMRTPGKPYALRLESNRDALKADGDDLAYVTVTVVDKEGNPVATAEPLVRFSVKGAGRFRAAANGDPTSLRPFHLPEMELFSGAATAILQSGDKPGDIVLKATSPGLRSASITIPVAK